METNVLKWIGGKAELAEYIIDRMPPHEMYVEVFGGALNVFLQKPLAKFNVVNDINQNLVNLYRVIHSPTLKPLLLEQLDHAVYSRDMFEHFRTLYKKPFIWKQLPQEERAFIFLYLNRTSFNGQFQSYARRNDSAVLYNLKDTINLMFKKFQAGRTVIENLHFKELLKSEYNKENVLIYLDPPYWVTTQSVGDKYYEHKMDEFEHPLMEQILRKFKKAKIIISYDDVPEVRMLYRDDMWHISNTKKVHQSSASTNKQQLFKSELIITNFDFINQNSLFES